jgi:hypothetical protein
MTSQDYRAILAEAIERLKRLVEQREELEAEVGNLRQFIGATIHMLPGGERERFLRWFNDTKRVGESRNIGLSESIRETLEGHPKRWFTVTQMRDALQASAFDFSDYKSNPLASISATLKRLYPSEIDYREMEGVAAYRWKPNTKSAKLRKANRQKEIERGKLSAMYGDEWMKFDPHGPDSWPIEPDDSEGET